MENYKNSIKQIKKGKGMKEMENLSENISEIEADIEIIRNNTDKYYWPAMESGYRYWCKGNKDKTEIEKLKFKKIYFLAYGNGN